MAPEMSPFRARFGPRITHCEQCHDCLLTRVLRSPWATRRATEDTMPLDFCHPHTPHKKLRIPEWYVSALMMDRALDAVVRRAKVVDRKHDIPYLAGYSLDGKTIYID